MNKNSFNILDVLQSGKSLVANTICRICLLPCNDMISLFDKLTVETKCRFSTKTTYNILVFELFEYITRFQGFEFSNRVCKKCVKRAKDAFIFETNLRKTECWLYSNVDKIKLKKDSKNEPEIPINIKGKDDFKIINDWLQLKISKLETKNISKLDKNISLDTKILPSTDTQNTMKNAIKSPEGLIPVYIVKMKKNNTDTIKTSVEEHDINVRENLFHKKAIVNGKHTKVSKDLKKMEPGSSKNKKINKTSSRQSTYVENTNSIVNNLINTQSASENNQQLTIQKDLTESPIKKELKRTDSRPSEITENIVLSDSLGEKPVIENKLQKDLKLIKTGSSIKNDDSVSRQYVSEDDDNNILHEPENSVGCLKENKKKTPNKKKRKVIKTFITNINQVNKFKSLPDCLIDHDYELVYCDICDQDFPNLFSYNSHSKVHTIRKCKLCNKEFSKPNILKQHMKSHSRKENKFIRDEPSIVSYPFKMTSKREKIYKCELCDILFVQILALFRHMRVNHVAKDKFGCNICGGSCENREDLLTHILCHDEFPYSCAHCPLKFSTVLEVSLHVKNHKDEPDLKINTKPDPEFDFVLDENNKRMYQCSQCDKKYNSKSTLKIHYKQHLGITYLCQICGKIFNTKYKLHTHMGTHSDIKRLQCDICGKKYKQYAGLRDHKMNHTGNFPFCCEVCGKRFKQRNPLEAHLKTHKNQKEYECKTCEIKFFTRNHLNIHKKRHNKTKKYTCKYCSKHFYNKTNLKYHEKRHEGKKYHSCSICKKTFLLPENLKLHMKNHKNTGVQ